MYKKYVFDYSDMPANERKELIKRIKSVCVLSNDEWKYNLMTFYLDENTSPDIFNIPDYCNLHIANQFDPEGIF